MAMLINVKVVCGEEIRVTQFYTNSNFMSEIERFYPEGKVRDEMVVKYKDLDDDLVTIKEQKDFCIACSILGIKPTIGGQSGRRSMKVYLFPRGDTGVSCQATPLLAAKPADSTTIASSMERGGDVNKGKNYRLLARFVEHVTYPIGTKVLPGEEFVKTWRVRNDSEKAWPNDVELIYVSGEAGDMMGPTASFPQIGGLKPSEIYDVSVKFKASTLPGTYEGFWRLRSISEGLKFGQRLRVCIQVASCVRKERRLLQVEVEDTDDAEVENLAASDMEKMTLDGDVKDILNDDGSKFCDDFECVDVIAEGTPVKKRIAAENESDDVFVEVLPNDAIIPVGESNPTGEDDGIENDDHDIVKVLRDLGVEYSDYKNVNEMRHVKVAYGKLKKHVHHMVRQAQRRRARKNQAKLEENKKQVKVA